MQFNAYKSNINTLEQFGRIRDDVNQVKSRRNMTLFNIGLTEIRWIQRNRPFYRVYPNVLRCLENTKLDYKLADLGVQVDSTALLLPKGHELDMGIHKIVAMLIEISSEKSIYNIVGQTEDNTHYDTICGKVEYMTDDVNGEVISSLTKKMLSILLGVALLAKDERFAKQILLQRDQNKLLRTQEEYDLAVARAKRRGVNGIAIGQDVDISPGYRRPHFGIRWTGKGGKVPRLVPVKGCLVGESKLYPLPSGYLGQVDTQE